MPEPKTWKILNINFTEKKNIPTKYNKWVRKYDSWGNLFSRKKKLNLRYILFSRKKKISNSINSVNSCKNPRPEKYQQNTNTKWLCTMMVLWEKKFQVCLLKNKQSPKIWNGSLSYYIYKRFEFQCSTFWAKSFTSLNEDLHQDINRGFVGIFLWRNCSVKALVS